MLWRHVHCAMLCCAAPDVGIVCARQPQKQTLFMLENFPQALVDVAWFSLLGAIGQLFIFYSISEFGTLVTTTICITRCVSWRAVTGRACASPAPRAYSRRRCVSRLVCAWCCSKFWSILLSVIRSPRPIELFQWVGIIAVFSGLGLEIYEKYTKQKAAQRRAADAKKGN